MCGIAGIVTVEGASPSERTLDDFQRALRHRGPDGAGRYSAPGLGLVQTRLAIIDLENGNQPLYGRSGEVLIANGEIYNYRELQSQFKNDKFDTQSDCELPLHTYARDGADFTHALRGMYAIALADKTDRSLHLARDPFGIKPLYFVESSGGFVFASELRALLAANVVDRTIRRDTATELVQLQFTTGTHTIFAGVNRIAPGESLKVKAGKIVERCLQAALPKGLPIPVSEAEALVQLDKILMDTVSVHQRSDVPYGMFLSGGVDSSVLIACMSRLNQRPVRAFTASFPGTQARDESEHAATVARSVGAEHIKVEITANDFRKCLPSVVAALDDPVADYATLPTYMLAAEASRELKVVLTGEGGDELFAGYSRYRTALRPRWLGGRPMRRSGILDGFDILRESRHWRDGFSRAEERLRNAEYTELQRVQALDCAEWLPNDLLIKLDRCLMAHGVEGRTPFLDPLVANLAFRLPDNLKIANGSGKYLLRRWLERALPVADPFAKKRGFSVPAAEWIMPLTDDLAPMVARSCGIAEICFPERVEKLFRAFGDGGDKKKGAACWQLLFYALWHAIHVEGRDAHGDIFATLHSH